MELKLAEFRKKFNYTQVELAKQLGVSFQSISKWETGAAVPDVYMLMKLADLFSISIDELVGREFKHANIRRKDTPDYWGRQIDYLFESRKNLWNDDYFEFLVDKIWELHEPISIIDFGCGYGYLGLKLMPLLPEGSHYTGIDSNEELLEKAKEMFDQSAFSYELIHEDIYQFDTDKKYDLSICQALIRHSIKPMEILSKMVDATRSGGKLVCIDVNRVSEIVGYHNSAINYNPMISLDRFTKGWLSELNSGGRDYASGLKIPSYLKELGLVNVDARINDKLEIIEDFEEIKDFMKISSWPTEHLDKRKKELRINLRKENHSEEVIKRYLNWYEENIKTLLNEDIKKSITFSRGLIITYGDKL